MAWGGITLVQAVMFAATKTVPNKVAARPQETQYGLAEVETFFMLCLLQNLLEVVVNELQHTVYRRDGFGVDFVSALSFDHVDHFFHHVDVGGL